MGDKLKYHALLKLETRKEGVEKKDVPEGVSAATGYLIVSIILPKDGSYSQMWYTVDGRSDKPFEDEGIAVFKAWSLMAESLGKKTDLPDWQRKIAQDTFESLRKRMLSAHSDCIGPGCSAGH